MSNFGPSDIIWIKNVNDKDENGKSTGKAYMDENENDKLVLRFHPNSGDNINSPKVGELILLFQKDKNEDRFFTHLVTPIDDKTKSVSTIWHSEPKIVNGRDTKVVKKKKILVASMASWEKVDFRGISQGYACEIENISSVEKGKVLLKDLINDVWNAFNKI
ncbi:hypothetical protein R83H12_00663 [Fibrobacteria bacterium R8-3-H12]